LLELEYVGNFETHTDPKTGLEISRVGAGYRPQVRDLNNV
jgi:hypothetical protein